jgi:hypothetical protein
MRVATHSRDAVNLLDKPVNGNVAMVRGSVVSRKLISRCDK